MPIGWRRSSARDGVPHDRPAFRAAIRRGAEVEATVAAERFCRFLSRLPASSEPDVRSNEDHAVCQCQDGERPATAPGDAKDKHHQDKEWDRERSNRNDRAPPAEIAPGQLTNDQ